jgi:hypothetical protein
VHGLLLPHGSGHVDMHIHRGKDVTQIDSGALRQCPACRCESDLVAPSQTFYADGQQKKRVIASYRSEPNIFKSFHLEHLD